MYPGHRTSKHRPLLAGARIVTLAFVATGQSVLWPDPLASALAKMIATTSALSFGFVGGPIFPLLFVGSSLGSVVHLAIDDVPLALAVTASMAAVPSAVIPVPLSIAALTVLIAGLPPIESSTVFVAAVVALLASRAIETALPGPAPAAEG